MTMWNVNGQPFQARFIIVNGKVDVEIKSHYLQGRCPVCGGRIVKTGKGYACENSIPQDPLCGFHVPGILANRKITDSEMEDFLAGSAQVLDGFSNNEGKVFSSVLTLAEDGKVVLDSRIAVCPVCGGDILVSPQAFNCSNYSNPQVKCKFMAWRNIAGHVITKQEMVEICEEGQTREPLELYKNNGAIFYKRLGLRTTGLSSTSVLASVRIRRVSLKYSVYEQIGFDTGGCSKDWSFAAAGKGMSRCFPRCHW